MAKSVDNEHGRPVGKRRIRGRVTPKYGKTLTFAMRFQEYDQRVSEMFLLLHRALDTILERDDSKAFADQFIEACYRYKSTVEGMRKHLADVERRFGEIESRYERDAGWKPYVPKRDFIGTVVPSDKEIDDGICESG